MDRIRKITILGAGAMGAAYAAMFSDAEGFFVSFVAGGERYDRLRKSPLSVNGKRYAIPVVHPDEGPDRADLVIVALKHHHLAPGIGDISGLVGDDTTILSVMNGLESEEMIGAVYGMEKMVYAIAVGIDAVRQAGRFSYTNPGKIIFGAGPNAGGGNRVRHLKEALDRAGIPNQVPEDILRSLWWKFMINVGVNQASAVLRGPYGVFQSSPEAVALMTSLMEEVIALAAKAGIDLTDKDIDQWRDILGTLSPTGKTSMLQDIEAGRKTEVEIFAGKVVSLGARYGVATPVNQTVLRIIKVIEDRYLKPKLSV
ncbi:MAG: 2-dehydropantoate 2-reductase [Desulfobacterales bacterium]|nr:2-dehydropantoate 2-reductase [Desulfobacterales bacterium]